MSLTLTRSFASLEADNQFSYCDTDGKYLYAINRSDKKLRKYDFDGNLIRVHDAIAYTPYGFLIADKRIYILDSPGTQLLMYDLHLNLIRAIALFVPALLGLSFDGRLFGATKVADGNIYRFDLDGNIMPTITTDQPDAHSLYFDGYNYWQADRQSWKIHKLNQAGKSTTMLESVRVEDICTTKRSLIRFGAAAGYQNFYIYDYS